MLNYDWYTLIYSDFLNAKNTILGDVSEENIKTLTPSDLCGFEVT